MSTEGWEAVGIGMMSGWFKRMFDYLTDWLGRRSGWLGSMVGWSGRMMGSLRRMSGCDGKKLSRLVCFSAGNVWNMGRMWDERHVIRGKVIRITS